jgi:hypothetical protein
MVESNFAITLANERGCLVFELFNFIISSYFPKIFANSASLAFTSFSSDNLLILKIAKSLSFISFTVSSVIVKWFFI